MCLKAYNEQYKQSGCITRYVTAYGPRENDTHAIIALIKRALLHEDPYLVWGSGDQNRDFTYLDDIVMGTILAGANLSNCEAVNLGTGVCYTMKEIIENIFNVVKWKPKKIIFDTTKPEGVKSRCLDISYSSKIIGYKPQVDIKLGIEKTSKWLKTII
jgi:UDP-glucose 4-epimerase